MALYVYRTSNEAIPKYALVKLSTSVAGRVELYKIGDPVTSVVGVALTRATQAGVQIKVLEQNGVEATFLSDGTTTIAPGDNLEPSEVTDGYVRKGSTNVVGAATASVAAVSGLTVSGIVGLINDGGLPGPAGTGVVGGTTKGDVGVYDGADWVAVPVGPNDTVLTADSSQASGVKWGVGGGSRKITVPLVQPFDSSGTLANPAVYQAIYWIPPDVTEVYVSVANRQLYTPAGNAADITSMKIAGGAPSVDRQSISSSTVFTGLTYPAYVPCSPVTMPVARDANGYMAFRWTVPNGTAYLEYVTNAGQSGYVKTIQNSNDVTASSSWVDTSQPACQVLVTYNTTAPKLVIWSDSIQRGVAGANECGLLNSLASLGPERGYAVSSMGVAITQAGVWAGLSNWMLNDTSLVKGATVMIALGTNDVANSVSATTLIASFKRLFTDARGNGVKRIIACTIPPSSSFSGPQNVELALFNNWLRYQTKWYDDLLDLHSILKDPGTPTQLLPAYAATGGIHLTTAGFTAIKALFPTLT